MGARFQLNRNQDSLNGSMRKLATGKKINSGKDGPAALISAERLSAEIKALEAQSRSIARADANANIADGHVGQMSALASELKGLVVSSANSGAMSQAEVAANQLQIDSIVSSMERIGADATASLDGFNLPNDGNSQAAAQIASALASVQSLKSGAANSMSSGNFAAASTAIDSAITDVTTVQGTVGSYQKDTLGPQSRSTDVALAQLSEARSLIQDTDFAQETSLLARAKTLTAAGIKTLKIAQQQAGAVLDLLA